MPAASTVRAHFRTQALACRSLGSPFTATLLELAAERLDASAAVGRAILGWAGDPGADALALRFAGALHALVLSGAAAALAAAYPGGPREGAREALWPAVVGALATHAAFVLGFLDRPPQTNEVARAGALALGFLTVAQATGRPLVLLEIGASAGLNLHWDDYAYQFGGAAWGPPEAPLRLAPDWRGCGPPLVPVVVQARRGCDRQPLDPADAADRLRLRAYVWADQHERRRRLEAALEHAARRPLRVEPADAAAWVEARLAAPTPGAATVLFHSIVWQYLPERSGRRIEGALEAAGARALPDAPLAWLRMEPRPHAGHAELRLRLWPDGRDHHLADADFHGRWVHWRGLAESC